MNALSLTVVLTAGTACADPFGPPAAYSPNDPVATIGEVARPAPTAGVVPGYPATTYPAPGAVMGYQVPPPDAPAGLCEACIEPVRKPFQSDHAFDGFIGPVSNPVLAKDPRSNSYARLLFINNNLPGSHPLDGDIQAYALQTNLALTERLSIIADKDGYAHISPRRGPSASGFLNLAAGLKYTFYRDVENQTLAAIGFLYEIPSGEAKVQQNQGAGSFAPFLTFGKQFRENWHYLQTTGYYFPLQASQGSSFIWNSFHIDRQIGWFYPLAELNWFWYTSGGNRLPAAFGEGDGLLNLGTRGQAGAHLVTGALGAKAVLNKNYTVGFAYEIPLTNRHDIINNRLTVELIGRY
ncbi:MAG: hypothetical protein J0I06_26360 [Planctomycetes bacterium]|nr:hypothetical protein [Planctomycetota bacterium]